MRNIIGGPVQFLAYTDMNLKGGQAIEVATSSSAENSVAGNRIEWRSFEFNASLDVPTGYENKPVSISALACITY